MDALVKLFKVILCILIYGALPLYISQSFLFHIEQGREDNLSELKAQARAENRSAKTVHAKFSIGTHLIVFLIFAAYTMLFCLISKAAKVGAIITIIVSMIVYAGSIIYMIILAATPYQARAWNAFALISAITLFYGRMGANGKQTLFLFVICLIIISTIVSRVSAYVRKRSLESIEEEIDEE